MDQQLLTIGSFARAAGLTTSALRYYDQCGLLRPASVDESSGYRYYTPDLSRRAQAVARMREVGMSIESMRTALDGAPDERRRVLREIMAQAEADAVRKTSVIEELLRDEDTSGCITVNGPHLAAAIRQVSAAADHEPGSPLASVLLDAADGTLDVVSTNRYWMAIRELPCVAPARARTAVSMGDAQRLCHALDRHAEATLTISSRAISLTDRDYPAITEPYPAHRMVLEGLPEWRTAAHVSRADLLSAMQRASVDEVDVCVDSDGLTVEGHQVTGRTEGPGLGLKLGAALMSRAAASAIGPDVVLHLASDTRPVQLSSPHQPGFLALMMPMAGRSI